MKTTTELEARRDKLARKLAKRMRRANKTREKLETVEQLLSSEQLRANGDFGHTASSRPDNT